MTIRRRYIVIWLVVLVTVGLIADTLFAPSKAQSSQPLQWIGLSGLANHACYHHGLVQSLVLDGETDEADVVCVDHWSFNLSNNGDWSAN